VLARIRDYILTEENLKRLTIMVNEEIEHANAARESRRALIDSQLSEARKRLDRLFEGVEAGHVSFADVGPRIKKLRDEIDQLELEPFALNSGREVKLTQVMVAEAVLKLRSTLERGTFGQQKQFLRSFIRKIEYSHPKLTIVYTFPPLSVTSDGPGGPSDGPGGTEELSVKAGKSTVLCIDKKGSSGRTRTYNPPVNSPISPFLLPFAALCLVVIHCE